MTAQELRALSDGLVPVMRDYISRAVDERINAVLAKNAALEMRILELETRPPVIGPQGPAGERGEPGEKGEMGPAGVAGADGLSPTVDAIVAKALTLLPVPERGERGERGIDGMDGKDAPAVDVDALVTRVAALIPVPKDGLNGKDGAPGRDGTDGIGLRSSLIDRDGHLIETYSDGSIKDVGPVVGRDGIDGKDVDMEHIAALVTRELATWPRPKDGKDGRDGIDGKDGLGFEDADLVCDDAKGWVLRLASNGRTKDFPLPYPWDFGVWEAGRTYSKGSGVTHDGHFWIAQGDTLQPPGEGGDTAWRLVVRRGKQGKQGEKGSPGRDGRDLTQLGRDGEKW